MSAPTVRRPESAIPHWSRVLRAVGRGVARYVATDNPSLWLYGMGYPYLGPYAPPRYSERGDDQQP